MSDKDVEEGVPLGEGVLDNLQQFLSRPNLRPPRFTQPCQLWQDLFSESLLGPLRNPQHLGLRWLNDWLWGGLRLNDWLCDWLCNWLNDWLCNWLNDWLNDGLND